MKLARARARLAWGGPSVPNSRQGPLSAIDALDDVLGSELRTLESAVDANASVCGNDGDSVGGNVSDAGDDGHDEYMMEELVGNDGHDVADAVDANKEHKTEELIGNNGQESYCTASSALGYLNSFSGCYVQAALKSSTNISNHKFLDGQEDSDHSTVVIVAGETAGDSDAMPINPTLFLESLIKSVNPNVELLNSNGYDFFKTYHESCDTVKEHFWTQIPRDDESMWSLFRLMLVLVFEFSVANNKAEKVMNTVLQLPLVEQENVLQVTAASMAYINIINDGKHFT